jgi:hypothetical protein
VQVQLVRIQLRVPEYGWTTQKVFHLLNALVCSLRCGSFLFRAQMEQLHPDALRLVLFDLPGETQLDAAVWKEEFGDLFQQLCYTASRSRTAKQGSSSSKGVQTAHLTQGR